MIILPAIDVKGGKCVRLLKGDFLKVTQYKKSPVEQAREFLNHGFKNIHIVDLDGALEGKLINKKIIKEITKKNEFKIQVGGGIRSLESIEEWLDIGVDKVVIGTAAIENPEFLTKACNKYKGKIALAIDVRNGLIALSGWKKQTNIKALSYLEKIRNLDISRIIYTDINRDGTKTGPNILETEKLAKFFDIPFIISGGVSSIADITNIKNTKEKNIEGVIIGKAIYDGDINLKELNKFI